MNKKGIIAIISGFSGVGKGTIVKELVNRYGYVVSISATTRKPREGEVDGKSYFFKTQEEFEQMIKKDELMEYAQYVDHYYGTPKKYVMEQLEQGNDVLLEIEMQGALKIKEKFPLSPSSPNVVFLTVFVLLTIPAVMSFVSISVGMIFRFGSAEKPLSFASIAIVIHLHVQML